MVQARNKKRRKSHGTFAMHMHFMFSCHLQGFRITIRVLLIIQIESLDSLKKLLANLWWNICLSIAYIACLCLPCIEGLMILLDRYTSLKWLLTLLFIIVFPHHSRLWVRIHDLNSNTVLRGSYVLSVCNQMDVTLIVHSMRYVVRLTDNMMWKLQMKGSEP